MNTRRMVRNQELATGEDTCVFEDAITEPADKIVLPADVETKLVGTHQVVWSDIDTMAHVNNVKYVCWALDSIDEATLQEHNLQELLVNYDAEVLLGETVELHQVWIEENGQKVCYTQGMVDGKVKFSVKFIF